MRDTNNNISVIIVGLASILLAASVMDVAVGGPTATNGNAGATSGKSDHVICSKTDYKDTCEQSLAGSNSSDPRELIETAVKATIAHFTGVVKNSSLLKEAATDKSTKDAFDVCEIVLGTAVDDLNRSVEKISELSASTVGQYVEELKTWLSAVITNQDTCIDAFENTTGDTGEKMKKLLKTTRELSSNGLAMVDEVSSLLKSLDLGSIFGGRRHLTQVEQKLAKANLLAKVVPNAVVALDGSGQFKSINAALAKVPKKNTVPFFIYVKAGVYKEHVEVPKGAHKVVMFGDGPLKSVITDKKSFAGGVKTFQTSTLSVNADDFFAHDIGIHNEAGPEGHQAVAVRVSGDRAVFFNVHMYGYQDTLYTHTYRQFYRDCVISGTIDFIFGNALAIFQNCMFVVRKPMDNQACMVTAQGRIDPRSEGAIVIQNGNIVAEPAFLKSPKPIDAYLGRPWKELSRTIIMQSNIDGFISPDGWSPWMGSFALDTLYYAEYQNRGPGSNTAKRVTWKGIKHITPEEALNWTPGHAFGGDFWITGTGIPYVPAMVQFQNRGKRSGH